MDKETMDTALLWSFSICLFIPLIVVSFDALYKWATAYEGKETKTSILEYFEDSTGIHMLPLLGIGILICIAISLVVGLISASIYNVFSIHFPLDTNIIESLVSAPLPVQIVLWPAIFMVIYIPLTRLAYTKRRKNAAVYEKLLK